jgi:phosphatidylserine decarboxylase
MNTRNKLIIFSITLLFITQNLAYFNPFFYARSQAHKNKQLKSKNMNHKEGSPFLLQFLYQKGFGSVIRAALTRKWFSSLAGKYCDHKLSKKHIVPFIKEHSIDSSEALEPIENFKTFNDFFIRKLKPEARPINSEPRSIISPADGHVIIYEHYTRGSRFPVKQSTFNLEKFLGNKQLAKEYEGGTIMIFRLAPWDYHRFHFPLDCIPSKPTIINGKYESVNPLVYKTGIQPLTENERRVYSLKTSSCDDVAMISVGALCVGRIVETYKPDHEYCKGEEAGYFSFGGSTVVLIFKKGTLSINPEIITNSQEGKETPIKMGQKIALIAS